jgi:hypothetical protein
LLALLPVAVLAFIVLLPTLIEAFRPLPVRETTRVKIIADSITSYGKRITTFSLEYWRAIHAELMTHRLFSRNASSSRAIPVRKMIARVINDPAMPIHWGSNRPGMQATQQLAGWRLWVAKRLWLLARWPAIGAALIAVWIGLHKQVANRLLEPWMYINVVLTATELGNWFNVRYHPDAMPEIRELARQMWEAMQVSKPEHLSEGQWHLPYTDPSDAYDTETLLKISAARCARVSYMNHEGKKPSLEEDLALFERLMAAFVKHPSPCEHQARPQVVYNDLTMKIWQHHLWDVHPVHGLRPELDSNLKGWVQFRKLIPGEYLPDFKGPNEH